MIIPGSTRFCEANPCMQGDSIHKTCAREKESDWPTIVFDSGLSKPLSWPRIDAKWCPSNFRGKLGSVIIISITPARRSLRLEKWCLRRAIHAKATKAKPNSNAPTHVLQIVALAPIIFGFQDILLITLISPEGNIAITASGLVSWLSSSGMPLSSTTGSSHSDAKQNSSIYAPCFQSCAHTSSISEL